MLEQIISEDSAEEFVEDQFLEIPGSVERRTIDEIDDLLNQEAMQSIVEMAEIRRNGIHIRTKSQEIEMTLKFQLYDRLIKISKIEQALQEHRDRKRTIDATKTEQVEMGYFPDSEDFHEKLKTMRERAKARTLLNDTKKAQLLSQNKVAVPIQEISAKRGRKRKISQDYPT